MITNLKICKLKTEGAIAPSAFQVTDVKKILLILVGGTICTAVNEKGTLSVSEKAGFVLTDNFDKSDSEFAKKVNFTLTENLFILSENMTVKNWNLIIETYRKYIVKDNFDGVIFAHGTDTLAYSSALFSLLLANTEIPVFFVSSNKRLDHPEANGNENFRCAVECICKGISPNVYVSYKNISDSQMYIHLASRLKQCENYSDDFFSKGAVKSIEEINEDNRKNLPFGLNDVHLSECVLMLKPYPGINYNAFDYNRFKAILHGTYHSGTACAEDNENSVLHMIKLCKKSDIYLSPSIPEGEVYDTVRVIGENKKIKFLYGLTNEMAYAKLLIAYSVFNNENDISEFINTEYNYEITEKR